MARATDAALRRVAPVRGLDLPLLQSEAMILWGLLDRVVAQPLTAGLSVDEAVQIGWVQQRLSLLCREHPFAPVTSSMWLDRIQAVLSGQEWSADTCQKVAQLVAGSGRPVHDYDPSGS